MAEKDPELLLAEKLSLEDEVQRLKTKAANLEQENFGKLSAIENPKEKLLQLFTAFDADKDGFLNGSELQDLAFQVDVVIPQMDLEKCTKELTGGVSNKVDFESFFKWWSTPAAFDAGKNAKLAMAQLKLQQPACITALLRVVQSLSLLTVPTLTATIRENTPNVSVVPKSDTVPTLPETAKVKVSVTMGHFEEPHSSAKLSFERNRQKVEEMEKEFGTMVGAAVLEAQLLLKPDANPETVKTLKAEASSILNELRGPLKFALFSVREKPIDAKQMALSVCVVWQDKSMLEALRQTLAALEVRSLALQLELSQKPGDPIHGFVRIRGDVSAEVSRIGLHYLITKMFSTESWNSKAFMNMISCFTDVNINLSAHEVTQILKEVLKDAGTPVAIAQSWNALRVLIGPLMAELDADASVPRMIPNTYFAAVGVLLGPHLIRLGFDDHLAQLCFEDLHVTAVLPTRADIQKLTEEGLEAKDKEDDNDNDLRDSGGGRFSDDEIDLSEMPRKKKY